MSTWCPMSDGIREALAEILRDNMYPRDDDEFLDLLLADIILKKFLVVPRTSSFTTTLNTMGQDIEKALRDQGAQ